jgi:Zn finger protein HypA/HybF involved in hydrogenase expression
MQQLKHIKPVYAQCPNCFKKYDMVEWGVRCPACKDKDFSKENKKH